MLKTVVTIVGIRPDFIRMSEIFRQLDLNFNHILIHTGQHFEKLLSDVFFEDLEIRQPDYNLGIGGVNKPHNVQLADLSVKIVELFKKENIKPDIIIFLGDSNSVLVSPVLKKEGYRIGHIEAGMRSYDRRMFEEIDRVVCDHVSDELFVYHEDYRTNLVKEGIDPQHIHNVGNTIVEVCDRFSEALYITPKQNRQIILDIHRPENFKYIARMYTIIAFAGMCQNNYNLLVRMIKFGRTYDAIKSYGLELGKIELIDNMSYKKYLEEIYNSLFIISDSGTAQEEAALLGTPVCTPRDYTERPQSVTNNCSYMLNVSGMDSDRITDFFTWLTMCFRNPSRIKTEWLGNGQTASKIIDILKDVL
jgi:UDP-N-acetylglucosamine 2-epimerase (non-hydrolysing)